MALSANTVWEVRTTGSDTNGGGFVTGASGTDWSQQDAAQYSVTDGVTNGTTTITSATANFGTDVVGNIIYVQGGTGSVTADWYQITARTNSTTITVDRSTGLTAGTGVTLKIGGSLLSGSIPCAKATTGNKMWIKAGSYTISSTSTGVANGIWSFSVRFEIEGYNSSRGDLGTAPVLTASGISSTTLITAASGSNDSLIKNITVNGASLTSIKGIDLPTRTNLYKCWAQNCTNSGIVGGSSGAVVIFCRASGCSSQPAFSGGIFWFCEAYSNTVTGFGGSFQSWNYCISYLNTGASSHGFVFTNGSNALSCIAYANGGTGFYGGGGTVTNTLANCIAELNASKGFDFTGSDIVLLNCGGYSNTSSNTLTASPIMNINYVNNTTNSFFINAAAGDFSLNNTSSAGASCRATGFPGTFPRGLSVGGLDIGTVQTVLPTASQIAAAMWAYGHRQLT